jgi:peptide/nickel transport system permease protein
VVDGGISGVAILVTTLGFNLLGDGLNDILDPRHGAHER